MVWRIPIDGLLNSSTPERRLEIMKDPRLGTFGAVGLILTMALKISVLTVLPIKSELAGHTPGCFDGPLVVIVVRVPAGSSPRWDRSSFQTRAQTVGSGIGSRHPLGLTVLCGWRGLAALLFACLCAIGIFQLARVRLGGVTGDILGFMVETVEIVILLVMVVHV